MLCQILSSSPSQIHSKISTEIHQSFTSKLWMNWAHPHHQLTLWNTLCNLFTLTLNLYTLHSLCPNSIRQQFTTQKNQEKKKKEGERVWIKSKNLRINFLPGHWSLLSGLLLSSPLAHRATLTRALLSLVGKCEDLIFSSFLLRSCYHTIEVVLLNRFPPSISWTRVC